MSTEPPPRPSRAWLTPAGLAILAALMGVLAAFAVPRLTNYSVGDIEFTGWSGPPSRLLFSGRTPYLDFVLPIPPGSMVVLSAIGRLAGEQRLLHELGLIAVCQIGMALLAFTIVRPVTTRENALLVAFASAVVLLRGFKECAYDQTAALVAWGSVALGARALTLAASRTRAALWAACGALAACTFYFKQSTALGTLAGWPLVFGYLGLVGTEQRRDLARSLLAWLVGVGAGLALVAVGLWAIGSTLPAFYQAVIADGPALKGGRRAVTANIAYYLLGAPIYPASLLLSLIAGALLVRMARQPGGLHLGDLAPSAELAPRRFAAIVALATLAFGTAIVLLVAHVRALPEQLAYWTDRLRLVPGFGLLLLCVTGVAHLTRSRDQAPEAWRRGHALNALGVVTLAATLAHNLSSPEFRPFYDPNPVIPVALLCLFAAFDKAALGKLKLGVFALVLASLLSPRFDRALAAQIPIGRHGNWGGLFVGESALPVVKAALRVRELANERETVLVLPEDLQIAALIGRPRPPIRGAVVFVDQYAPRLVDEDLLRLERDLPKVVVIRPAERNLWAIMFANWNSNSGARRVIERFLDDWLPRHYRRDSSFVSRFGEHQGTLEIWVRN